MDHKEKVERMLQEFATGKLTEFDLAPPIHRLLWKCGFKIAPPLFASFLSLLVFHGVLWAIGFIFIKGLLFDVDYNYKETGVDLILSIVFGVIMAIFYRMKARGLDLPLWKDYLKDEDVGEAKGTARKKGSVLKKHGGQT